MSAPRTLFGVGAYINGVDYVGVVSKFSPPDIEAKVREVEAPGHGGVLAIPTGRLMKLEAEVVVGDAIPELEGLAGNPESVRVPVLLVSASSGGATQAPRREEWELAGLWTKQSAGEQDPEADGVVERTYTVVAHELTHSVDNVEKRHIDVERNIHRIDGVDVNEAYRAALSA